MKLNPIGQNRASISLDSERTVFFSYSTCVGAIIRGQCYRTEKFFSKTTSKHLNNFFKDCENVQEKPQSFFDDLIK